MTAFTPKLAQGRQLGRSGKLAAIWGIAAVALMHSGRQPVTYAVEKVENRRTLKISQMVRFEVLRRCGEMAPYEIPITLPARPH